MHGPASASSSGLYKRKHFRGKGTGNPLLDALQARFEPSFVIARCSTGSARRLARRSRASSLHSRAPSGRSGQWPTPWTTWRAATRRFRRCRKFFEPFTSTPIGPFDCSNTRAAYARLSEEDRKKLPWAPESLDWADWMMNVHMPAMVRHVIPEIDRRLRKEVRPLAAHGTLVSMLSEMAERHDRRLALQRMTDDGLTRTTYAETLRGAESLAARLSAIGVEHGERVALSGRNDPDWAVAFFGILRAGATAVPVDPNLDASEWLNVLRTSDSRVVIWDDAVKARGAIVAARPGLVWLDLHEAAAPDESLRPPRIQADPSDVASILFTSGTTGRPKGVMLTHANFTSLVAALAPLFPLSAGDAVLSVLPLHHTFEFTCGLLLPLSRGARVVYVGEISGERVARGLKESRATAMVGVPALWQLLERRILQDVDARGPFARAVFDAAGELNRWLARSAGLDAGRILLALSTRRWAETSAGSSRAERRCPAKRRNVSRAWGCTWRRVMG